MCLLVLEGHAPSPFVLCLLETAALRLISNHALWSAEELLRFTSSTQPLAFADFTLASVLAMVFLSALVCFEFLRTPSSFTSKPMRLPELADLPPLLKWWLIILSNSPGGTPVSANFLLPGYAGMDLVNKSPVYKILCVLHSGLRDALDYCHKTTQFSHHSPVELLCEIGWLQAVFPRYFFEGGVHLHGKTVAPDFFLLSLRTICTFGAVAGFCVRPGKRCVPETLNLNATTTLQKISTGLVPSLVETASSTTMFVVPLPPKSCGHWADAPELEHTMEAARLPRSLLLASSSVNHAHAA